MLFAIEGFLYIRCEFIQCICCALHFSKAKLVAREMGVTLEEEGKSTINYLFHQFASTAIEGDWSVVFYTGWWFAWFWER